jgi:hypothetical protein
MRRQSGRVLITVAAVAVALSLPAVPSSAATSACAATDLAGGFGATDGAAGTIYNVFELTNVSGQACTINGYPGLIRFGRNGRTQKTVLVKDIQPGPASITVLPGEQASFVWAYTDVPSGSATSCKTTRVLGVSVPGSSSSLYLAGTFPKCSNRLRVSGIDSGVISPG